jgi:hypothetical protein
MPAKPNDRDASVIGLVANGEEIQTIDGYIGSCGVDPCILNIHHAASLVCRKLYPYEDITYWNLAA